MQHSPSIKLLVMATGLLISVSAYGQKKENYSINYKSGKVQLESVYDSVCNCGRVTEYYESGKVSSRKTYVHAGQLGMGQLSGDDYRYFENGTTQLYYSWKDGAPDGRAYSNFANGKLAYQKFFAGKYKTGTWTFYNEDGSKREELIFTEKKTPWDSNDDYAQQKFYLDNKLAYSVDLVAGRKENLKIADTKAYTQLINDNPVTGKKLFIANCGTCHGIDKDIVGPAMRGVTKRRTNDWLLQMITNGSALVKSGDKDAVELYQKWYRTEHPNFERLGTEGVTAIMDYLKTLK